MKAAMYNEYGSADVIQLCDIKIPTPNNNEVLVKIKAASIIRADVMMRQGEPKIGRMFLGLSKPKHNHLGTGFSGTIVSIGNKVSEFEIGNDVFGLVLFGVGTNAEYICVPTSGLLFDKPRNICHSQAASLGDGALTSMNFLHNLANISAGDAVLINGASGSLGCAAIQIAKYFGAHVTAVCSENNKELVQHLGADNVIDYTKKTTDNELGIYDIIYDTIGTLPYKSYKNSLAARGIYLCPVLSIKLLFRAALTSLTSRKKVIFSATGILTTEKMKSLFSLVIEMIWEGRLTPVLDREFQIEQISDAHRYIETARKKGNVSLVFK